MPRSALAQKSFLTHQFPSQALTAYPQSPRPETRQSAFICGGKNYTNTSLNPALQFHESTHSVSHRLQCAKHSFCSPKGQEKSLVEFVNLHIHIPLPAQESFVFLLCAFAFHQTSRSNHHWMRDKAEVAACYPRPPLPCETVHTRRHYFQSTPLAFSKLLACPVLLLCSVFWPFPAPAPRPKAQASPAIPEGCSAQSSFCHQSHFA